jgi:hypothetical protein
MAKIRWAAGVLDGQKLIRFSISPRKVQSTFEFDLGATLNTWPYDKVSEQWLLYEPSQKVLVVRADGSYRHTRSDIPERPRDWKPIQGNAS